MKNNRKNVCSSIFLLTLATAPVLCAVERPAEFDEKPHQLQKNLTEAEPASEPAPANEPGNEPLNEPAAKIQEEQRGAQGDVILEGNKAAVVPYLGVGSTPIDSLLSGHLGIERGVVIQQVHAGSAAAKAGLQKNDILTSFDGRKIATPVDLRDAVQDCKVGDEVAVDFIREGQKQENLVKLEKRPEGLPGVVMPDGRRGRAGLAQLGQLGKLRQVWPGKDGLPNGAQEKIDRLRDMLDEEFNGAGLGLKIEELLAGRLPGADGQVDIGINAESSVTWSDNHGTITMKMKDGQTAVLVRDNDGVVLYDGPWETEQDKAAVSPDVRERVENMGIKKQGDQLKFLMEVLPGGR